MKCYRHPLNFKSHFCLYLLKLTNSIQTRWRQCGHTHANRAQATAPEEIEPFQDRASSALNEVLGYIISKKCSILHLGNTTKAMLREDN